MPNICLIIFSLKDYGAVNALHKINVRLKIIEGDTNLFILTNQTEGSVDLDIPERQASNYVVFILIHQQVHSSSEDPQIQLWFPPVQAGAAEQS